VRLAALGRDEEAAPLFLQAGAPDAAARRFERLGDHLGLASCHEAAERWLQAARELGAAPAPEDGRPRVAAIQRLLYRHLQSSRLQGREKREVESLAQEADRLFARGELLPALAMFQLFGHAEVVADICRRLGWHEEALDWLLASGNTALALSYAREGGFAVSEAMLDSQLNRHPDDRRLSEKAFNEIRATFVQLLASFAQAREPQEATSKVEAFFAGAYTGFERADELSAAEIDLILKTHAATVIMNLLVSERMFSREPSRQFHDFAAQIAQAAAESGDLGLAACDQYARSTRRDGRAG
jgi:hypothetical protein